MPYRRRPIAAPDPRYRQEDPHHPSLRFEQIHPPKPVFSVRISKDHRPLDVRTNYDVMVWF